MLFQNDNSIKLSGGIDCAAVVISIHINGRRAHYIVLCWQDAPYEGTLFGRTMV